jgi:AcrR family transcriptional regulator
MTSLRHNRYLDAARNSLLDVGWRRSTLTDVARRAGVSRMTIYRSWPDMGSLLGDLMAREWAEVLTTVPLDAASRQARAPARIADAVIAMARGLRANDLFRRILDVDPELLLPYLLERPGRSQAAILEILVSEIRAGQSAGEVRAGSPDVLARTVLLAAHGVTLSARTMTGDGVDVADLEAELATFIRRGLAA